MFRPKQTTPEDAKRITGDLMRLRNGVKKD